MNPVKILLIEDSRTDALLVESLLAPEANLTVTHRPSLAAGRAQLALETFDAVLLDLGLPDSQGLDTFAALKSQAAHTPVIILTIKGDMTTALAAIQGGAQDYLPKSELSELLLARTIHYAIERKRLARQLLEAQEQVNVLSDLLPICSSCKKIRDDKGYWNQLESYFSKHANVLFSHGICPHCAAQLLAVENQTATGH